MGKTGCMIIAEIAQAHDGSLGAAHAYIDAIAAAGADAVKFQTHIAAAESTPAEPWRVKFSLQDASRYEYWRRMEFTEEQWAGLKKHADERGLKFLSSPFSVAAFELLSRVGVAAWKVASGEFNNLPLMEQMADSGLPVMLSTGMSRLEEIDRIVRYFQSRHVPLTVFQCTTAYPCPPEEVGLNLLPFFRHRYGCAVGLSDHSATIYAGLAAAALGIEALEVHVTFSRDCFGPDVAASLTTAELRELVAGVRFIERMIAHPVQKDEMAERLQGVRNIFTKSVAAVRDLPAGSTIGKADLTLKKPGTGLPAEFLSTLPGRKLARPVAANQLLAEDDLAPATSSAGVA
jgi:N,N'-diacetyllegionaminate synthase